MDDAQIEAIQFIQTDLIPEMVYNRCFCEPGSREFTEFESVSVTPLIKFQVNGTRQLFKGKVAIRFSGDVKSFHVIIKLLPITCQENDTAYGCFLNEEMFYNKMTAKYKLDISPKCYVADMGRYGRPVVVLEDLEAIEYRHLSTKLDGHHLKLLLEAIARFHACGIDLKHKEFSIFREYYAKLTETGDYGGNYSEKIQRALKTLETSESEYADRFRKEYGISEMRCDPNESPYFTICHGNLNLDHSLFLYEDHKPISVKIVGWSRMTYTCPTIDLESLLIETQLKSNCITQIYEKFNDYFNALFHASTALKDASLRQCVLTLFYLLLCSSTPGSLENVRELMGFLNSLQ